MAMVEKVGHDRRGNTLFKRDENGNEIWEDNNVLEIDENAEGDVAYKTENLSRKIDDQTREVPSIFDRWKQQEGIPW